MREMFLNLGLAFIPVSATLTALWLAARTRAQKAEDTIRQIALRAFVSADGTSRPTPELSAALDAIALEVERISEAQRFTTKLLTERSGPPGSRLPERAITPH